MLTNASMSSSWRRSWASHREAWAALLRVTSWETIRSWSARRSAVTSTSQAGKPGGLCPRQPRQPFASSTPTAGSAENCPDNAAAPREGGRSRSSPRCERAASDPGATRDAGAAMGTHSFASNDCGRHFGPTLRMGDRLGPGVPADFRRDRTHSNHISTHIGDPLSRGRWRARGPPTRPRGALIGRPSSFETLAFGVDRLKSRGEHMGHTSEQEQAQCPENRRRMTVSAG